MINQYQQLSEYLEKQYTIFLDDCRDSYGISEDIRNYDDFVKIIESRGLPQAISFDYDLGEGKSGADCAHWLVNYCIRNKKSLPKWSIHSGNSIGAANIRSILETFEKYFHYEI